MLAETVCRNPHCKTRYEAACDDSATVLRCPVCTQYNAIDHRDRVGDGRCKCGKPLDDHSGIRACK